MVTEPAGEPAAEGVPDLRLPALGVAAWAGALVGLALPTAGWAVPTAVGCVAAAVAHRRGRRVRTGLGLLLAFATVAGCASLRAHQVAHNPVADLAHRGESATVQLSVTSDPRLLPGRFEDFVVLRGRVRRVTSDSSVVELGAPVLVLAEPTWAEVPLGSVVRTRGRFGVAEGRDLSGVLRPFGDPVVVHRPAVWWRAADRVRASLWASVTGVPEAHRQLVPALVVGDDEGLDPSLAADFATTGLTHLLAVSGTNLTLLLGFLLVVGRWLGVRGRWTYALGLVGVVGFVLLARPEPSVLRAAVMGSVALVGMGAGGTRRGARTLGLAVALLVLVDPWLAWLPGFALSVLATAGIVFLAPAWRDALAGWLPRWLAEALAVPAAAQLACTPVVAGLSGQVSLVAVVTNLLAAPAVGPATVLGLAGALTGLVWPALGRLCGQVAGWCVAWIAAVAERGAALPTPAVEGVSGPVALVALTASCLAVAGLAPLALRRRSLGVGCSLLLVVVVLVRPPVPGWPPDGWLLAACDVGQGDALVLNAGGGTGVVVDAGPDPVLVDRCLRRLQVRRVPLVVLTHFHGDHVDGLAGVLHGRRVDRMEVTTLADPPAGVALVDREAGAIPVVPATYSSTRRIGQVTLQVLWPPPDQPSVGPGDGSTANNASVVLLAQVRGLRLLLTGDVEPEAQAALHTRLPGLRVDVLKVPHHGSRYQDLDFLTSLHARLGLVSVGVDNDYGHPAPETIGALAAAGTRLLRTDRAGDVIVLERDGRLLTQTRR